MESTMMIEEDELRSGMDVALELNNEGALCLSSDEEEEFVVECFSDALENLKRFVLHEAVSDPERACEHATNFKINGLECSPLFSWPCHGDVDPSSHRLYDRALVISEGSPVTQEIMPLYVCCVLLNTGIANHRLAIKKNPALYDKIQELYQAVTRFLSSSFLRDTPAALAMRVVALNNLADLYCLRGMYGAAQQTAELLSTVLAVVRKLHYLNPSNLPVQLFNVQDLNAILYNVAMWRNTNVSAPAA
eukprot:CAMPEP_0178734928 /NCGR_PEP_ID=MMETSP0744-20121128/1612_1 /TAXON_ID=913974 /ORGANISM="Nitzschia punctata, Strain CCMP561" /LENGTH=247 /DNA_ID=CAMNT_0020387255 /DNA_START=193 /DNA_END=936 /DNA_ORIENTATION=+